MMRKKNGLEIVRDLERRLTDISSEFLRITELSLMQCRERLKLRSGTAPILFVLPSQIRSFLEGFTTDKPLSSKGKIATQLRSFMSKNGIVQEPLSSAMQIRGALAELEFVVDEKVLRWVDGVIGILEKVESEFDAHPSLEQSEFDALNLLKIEIFDTKTLGRVFVFDRELVDEEFKALYDNSNVRSLVPEAGKSTTTDSEFAIVAERSRRLRQLCFVVRSAGRRVERWLRKQPNVGEESITDWLLFYLSERIEWIHYLKFTKHEEAHVTGADWEWWFVFSELSIGLRVQAKKVRDGLDHYREVAFTNRYGLQIERLLEDALRSNLLPFYSLYYGGSLSQMQEGVFLARAPELYRFIKSGRRRIETADLLGSAISLTSLFCLDEAPIEERRPRAENGGPPVIERLYSRLGGGDGGSGEMYPNGAKSGIHKDLPKHVESILAHKIDESESRQETAVHDVITGAGAILICDLRDRR